MTDKQIIEYPHCRDCPEYYICSKKGYNIYKPRFLKKQPCGSDCPYDYNCNFECIEYRQWCYEDMEVAKELGAMRFEGCYEPPLARIDFKSIISEIKEKGRIIWANLINR